MAETAAFPSIAALQTAATQPGAVVYLTEPGREGTFVWRTGNFVAAIARDPRKGLFVPSSTTMPSSGCWVRQWDGVNGRPEWFGAATNDPAIDNCGALEACFALCPVTQLGAADYYIQRTLTFDRSNAAFLGVPGAPVNRDVGVGAPAPMGKSGGSRVILTGPSVVADAVFQFGKAVPPRSDGEEMMRNSVLSNIHFCRDNANGYKARNSPTMQPADCVKGIVCSGLSSCRIEGVSSFDSPVGWRCFGCVYTKWDDCAAWRSTPAAIATNDFSVGFLIGDFDPYYGYAGANASVYFDRCICYDLAGGSTTIAMRIFGAVADTFVTQPELGRCDVGLEIDGSGRDGVTISVDKLGSQQDIHLIQPIIDAVRGQGLQFRNLNRSFQVSVISPYVASANALADIHVMGGAARVEGHISVVGGVLLSGGGTGLVATDGEGISILGTLFRNYKTPISMTNCRSCRIEPDVFNYATVAANGLYLKDLQRSSVKPIVRAAPGRPGFVTGIQLDGGANNAIDPTMVDPQSFTSPTPEQKVRYRGEDARTSAAFRGAGNVLQGVVG
jgi:hypothetical protein